MFDKKAIESMPFFFIIGRSRSGTTLIRTLFDAHPAVNISLECPFIFNLYEKFGGINNWDKSTLIDFYNSLQKQSFVNYYNFSEMNFNHQQLKKDILACEGNCSFQTLIKTIYFNFKSDFNKKEIKILGDKNPSYSLQIEKLYSLFPDAKYIYITRDYRDNIISVQKAGFGKKQQSVEKIAIKWRTAAKHTNKLMKQHPESFLHVKYEDFVANPSKNFKQMCRFLGIGYDASVFDFYKKREQATFYSKDIMDKYQKSLFKPIDASKVEGWKKTMPEKDVRLADLIIGKYAEFSGYKRKYKSRNPISLFLVWYPFIIRKPLKKFFRKIFLQRLPDKIRLLIKAKSRFYGANSF